MAIQTTYKNGAPTLAWAPTLKGSTSLGGNTHTPAQTRQTVVLNDVPQGGHAPPTTGQIWPRTVA